MDPSIKVKFKILDETGQEIFRGSNKWFADFWDTFLGWIISLPNTYTFQNGRVLRRKLSSMKILFTGKSQNHDINAVINNPALNRGAKKKPSYFQIDDDQYHIYRAQRGNYFSLYNGDDKIFAMKKAHRKRDTFEAAFHEERLDNETAAMIMVALADSI